MASHGCVRRTGMKQRKPKDLAEKMDMDESLRDRYSEVVKLRELVKKAESKLDDGKSQRSTSCSPRLAADGAPLRQ